MTSPRSVVPPPLASTIDLAPVITHRIPFEQFEKGFDAMASGVDVRLGFDAALMLDGGPSTQLSAAVNQLGVGPQGLGGMLSAVGIGAVATALLIAWLGDFARKGLAVTLAERMDAGVGAARAAELACQVFGAPHAYVQRLRLEHAKNSLARTEVDRHRLCGGGAQSRRGAYG